MKQPENTLVFEDLDRLDYMMGSRETGLDEAHAGLVMERLAEFHAASMALAVLVSEKNTKLPGLHRRKETL